MLLGIWYLLISINGLLRNAIKFVSLDELSLSQFVDFWIKGLEIDSVIMSFDIEPIGA